MDQTTYEAIRMKLREKQRAEEDARILMQEVINELKRGINESTGYKCCSVGRVDERGNFVSELDGAADGLNFTVKVEFSGTGNRAGNAFIVPFNIKMDDGSLLVTRLEDSHVVRFQAHETSSPAVIGTLAAVVSDSIQKQVSRLLET